MLPFFLQRQNSRELTETKVFGEKYVLRADAKHSDLLHPSLSELGTHSTGQGVCVSPSCSPLSFACPIPPPPPSMLSPGQAILLKTLFHPLE